MPPPRPDELFDVVDEADRVVGRATRAVVHRDGLRHRAAHVFLLNSQGELFLQRRSLAKDENPGLWDSSAAGHLDAGESYVEAARRELAEELGVVVAAARLVERAALPASPDTGHEFRRLFVVTADDPVRADPDEVMDGRFFPVDALDRHLADGSLAVTRAFRELYARFRAGPTAVPSGRRGPCFASLGMTTRPNEEIRRPEDRPPGEAAPAEAGGLADEVEEGSIESFPASDPPAWMPPTTTLGPPRRD